MSENEQLYEGMDLFYELLEIAANEDCKCCGGHGWLKKPYYAPEICDCVKAALV